MNTPEMKGMGDGIVGGTSCDSLGGRREGLNAAVPLGKE